MRKIFLTVFLAATACWPQTIASRRSKEPTPFQMVFNGFQCNAPFCNQPTTSTTAASVLQPSQFITDNNQFAATTDFTFSGGSSFTVTGGVGTITTTSSASATTTLASNGTSCTSGPSCFIAIEVTSQGTTTGTDTISPCVYTSAGTHQICAQFNVVAHTADIFVWDGAASHDLASVSFTTTTAPYCLALSYDNTNAVAWYATTPDATTGCSLNSTAQYKYITGADTQSFVDLSTNGSMTSAISYIRIFTSQTTTWKLAHMVTGLPSGVSFAVPRWVTYPDGRPYIKGSTAYFTAGVNMPVPASSTTLNSTLLIYSVDLSTLTVTPLSFVWLNFGTNTYAIGPLALTVNPATTTERMVAATWGKVTTATTVNLEYASWSTGTMDLLSGGVFTIGSLTQLTLPGTASNIGEDPSLACIAYNYSANTCGKWGLYFTSTGTASTFYPCLQTTTSDPSANVWTSVGCDTTHGNYEGSEFIRTATGSGGVAYYGVFGGVVNAETRNTRVYDTAMTYAGALTSFYPSAGPGAGDSPPHSALLAFNNKQYYLASDNTPGGGTAFGEGNMVQASAPKYPSITTYTAPTFVAGCGNVSNASSVSSLACSTNLTATAGDLIVVACTATGPTDGTGYASVGMAGQTTSFGSWDNAILTTGATALFQIFYGFASSNGTVTPTCYWGTSRTYARMVAAQYHPGSLTKLDSAQAYTNITTAGTTYTTGSFSTTGQGLVIVCGDPSSAGSTITAGTIGGNAATLRVSASPANVGLSCEDYQPVSALTTVTGSMTNASSTVWTGGVVSFRGN